MKAIFIIFSFLCTCFLSIFHNNRLGITNDKADSLKADRKRHIDLLSTQINGKEQEDVKKVFKNLKELGGFPAENLLYAMDKWSVALGVSCGHCHNTNNWESDEKIEKEVARQMIKMGEAINQDWLRKMKGIKSEKPLVNCATCHRGQTKPALKIIE